MEMENTPGLTAHSSPIRSRSRDRHISSPLPRDTLEYLAKNLWAVEPVVDSTRHNLQPYSHYYTRQCRNFYHSHGVNFPYSAHEDLIRVGIDLRQGHTRQQAVRFLSDRGCAAAPSGQAHCTEGINGAVDLVARLLLMADVGMPVRNRIYTGRSHRLWNGSTINDFTTGIFSPHQSAGPGGHRMDQAFNARNLEVIGGLRVELTDNIIDHLDIVEFEGETTVMIFHHASFLKSQQHPLYPVGLLQETLQTLAFLFPQNEWYEKSKSWYRKTANDTDTDMAVFDCGPLTMTDFEDFRYWHGRLVRLKQVYDQARPRTLRQWWHDRRDGTQWYALWIVLGFTVFFGLVQSIEGALQVYKSYHPRNDDA